MGCIHLFTHSSENFSRAKRRITLQLQVSWGLPWKRHVVHSNSQLVWHWQWRMWRGQGPLSLQQAFCHRHACRKRDLQLLPRVCGRWKELQQGHAGLSEEDAPIRLFLQSQFFTGLYSFGFEFFSHYFFFSWGCAGERRDIEGVRHLYLI